MVCCLAIAHGGLRNASYVFSNFSASSGWVDGWSFCIGLLHAAYATSATGMILPMFEEVKEPATQVPVAMVGALVMNFICGLVFLVPLVFVLPDIATILASPYAQPLPVILQSAIGHEGGAFALTIPIIVLGLLCGTACTTASSRCAWAFARDGAIPGSSWWKAINHKLDVPLNAMMMLMIIELCLGAIYFGSAAAFNAFS
jgi:amino acid transporter